MNIYLISENTNCLQAVVLLLDHNFINDIQEEILWIAS